MDIDKQILNKVLEIRTQSKKGYKIKLHKNYL